MHLSPCKELLGGSSSRAACEWSVTGTSCALQGPKGDKGSRGEMVSADPTLGVLKRVPDFEQSRVTLGSAVTTGLP